MTNKTIVDIAVLAQDLNQPYKIDEEIPIFDLIPKTPVLSVENFIRLFYSNGINNKFCVNSNNGALTGTKQTGFFYSPCCINELTSEPLINYISFKDQSVMREDDDYDDSLKFNLKDSIFSAYSDPETGLGCSPAFWTACSRIELTEQLLKLCFLYNICNVCCSLTFIEALESIVSDNTLNLFENSIVKFRVSVVFTNDNEYIKDVVVRFNYFVDLDTGKGIIPDNLMSKLANNPCEQLKYCKVPQGHIKQINFVYSHYYNKNNLVGLSDIKNWTLERDGYYYSRNILILKKMLVGKNTDNISNNTVFKIRIKVLQNYYHFFNENGYVDQNKLCVEILSSTPNFFEIGDTINLAVYDEDNAGESINGIVVNSYNNEDCLLPVSVNTIFKKLTDCPYFSFDDLKCNPLLLTVCKIC